MAILSRVLVALALLVGGACGPAFAENNSAIVQVTSGVRYEFLSEWDSARLNRILEAETPDFAGIPVTYSPARNAVRLYRVTYSSVIPERGNRPTTSTGLIATPVISETSFPMVSYQHGTVYGKQEVPSFPDQSPETQLMIAQFAGQGYVVIGADYFGMGLSDEAAISRLPLTCLWPAAPYSVI